MTLSAALSVTLVAGALIVLVGLACYAQGRRDAASDLFDLAAVGAAVTRELADLPADRDLVIFFDRAEDGTFHVTLSQPATDRDEA